MDHKSENLQISQFRQRIVVWIMLFCLSSSFLPAVSHAQQPTAMMSTVSGTVLVNGQQQAQGTMLNAGDILETQSGASVILTLSDGSLLEVGEETQINLSELTQTVTQARVSRIKLVWGWMRAKLSPGHQHAGSSFNIETPNAVIGVKFSQPDVEVSYDPAKQETIGLAHTVELIAKNILTNEEMLVPVGSTVIIVGATIKIIAGILAITAASEAGTASVSTAATTTESTGTASAESASSTATSSIGTSSTGMGTGTKVVLGVGAAAAVGGTIALAVTTSSNEDEGNNGESPTAEDTGNLSGRWDFGASCIAYDCEPTIDSPNPACVGMGMCNCCGLTPAYAQLYVTQVNNTLSATNPYRSLTGGVNGRSVSFTVTNGFAMPLSMSTDNFTGTLSGNTITGTLEGFGNAYGSGTSVPMTWNGTFTVTINK